MNDETPLFFETKPSMGGFVTRKSNFHEIISFPYGCNGEYGLDKNGYWHNVQLGCANGVDWQKSAETNQLIQSQDTDTCKLMHRGLGEGIVLSDEKYICSRWQLTWDNKKKDFSDYGGYHPDVPNSKDGLKKHLIANYLEQCPNLQGVFERMFYEDGRMSQQVIDEALYTDKFPLVSGK